VNACSNRKRGDQLELGLARSPHRNTAAVERTLVALRKAERLEAVDAALIAAVRTSARALDAASSPYTAATVLRVHLEALRFLAGRPSPEPDELDAFLASLRRPAAVGNLENTEPG
jgi:hypothetical protein